MRGILRKDEEERDRKRSQLLNKKARDIYEMCRMRKASKFPHTILYAKTARGPLGLIRVALCGLMPVKSLNDSRYIFVLTNDYNRYVYFVHIF
jgi:hypothetical protein